MRACSSTGLVLASRLSCSCFIAGCGSAAAAGPTPLPPTAASVAPSAEPASLPPKTVVATTLESVGLDPLAMDRSVSPCTDFYQFACGNWLKQTQIPADEPIWSRSFNEIHKQNELELQRILETAGKTQSQDPVLQKLGAFYGACMDEHAVDAAGVQPIRGLLAKAGSVTDVKSLVKVTSELHAAGIWPLFELSPTQDQDDATHWVANLDQGGLGLPDRDYYTRTDEKSEKLRAVYREHVQKMLVLAGVPAERAQRDSADVLTLETELAKISKTNVERRDPKTMFNRLNRDGVAKALPAFGWDEYFQLLGFPAIRQINVTSPKFLQGLQPLLTSTKPSVWQSYLRWQIVHSTARLLSKPFVDESFKLEQALTGQPEQRARWKRCVAATDASLGELLAQPYVKDDFPGDSKLAANSMVSAISGAFGQELQSLEWMDAPTRARAREKLSNMAYLVGYPAKWKTYDYPVDKRSYAANALRSRAFELKRDLSKVGNPVDRAEWDMTPPTVNAYYDPQRNQMVFPAGILQPPFYSLKSGAPENFGAIGMVVGHELTHGFDDEGSEFDAQGNLKSWWSTAVRASFDAKTACVSKQYSGFEALPGLNVNGALTLGENIADIAGLKLAFAAYEASRKNSTETLVAGGFSEEQQFFLAFAQGWCTVVRPEFERMLVQTNPHSPARFRVRGPLLNNPGFASAFACSAGTPMHAATSCTVW